MFYRISLELYKRPLTSSLFISPASVSTCVFKHLILADDIYLNNTKTLHVKNKPILAYLEKKITHILHLIAPRYDVFRRRYSIFTMFPYYIYCDLELGSRSTKFISIRDIYGPMITRNFQNKLSKTAVGIAFTNIDMEVSNKQPSGPIGPELRKSPLNTCTT